MEKEEHRVVAPDGVSLALHRVVPIRSDGHPPVLLVPGTFTNRTFWLGSRGEGLAAVLAAAGFDAWVLELRGHGASDRPRRWSMTDWIERDAPAAAQRVLEATGAASFFWIGHSAGGAVGAAFSGAPYAVAARLQGLVLLGAPGPGTMAGRRRWLSLAGYAASALLPSARVPGAPLGLGPEREPARLVKEWLGWNLSGTWRDPRGGDYLAALAGVRVPVLAVAGAGDRLLAPPHAVRDLLDRFGAADRTLLRAGLRDGFREDFGHAGLVIGRAAREEIWPRLVQWLISRAGRPALQPCDSETRERA